MTTTAFLGSGSLLKIGDAASPEVFTTIYEVTDIGDFGQENDLVEVTHMQSTAKEYIYGLADGVEFGVSVNYNPTNATHVALLVAQAARTTKNMKLTLPSGGGSLTFSFAALIKGWRLPLGPNAAGVMTFNLKLSGSITGPV
jgi:hypothetical protein